MSSLATEGTAARPVSSEARLREGHRLEAAGRLEEALVAYDESLALATGHPGRAVADRRAAAIAWMNRGNVLQKLGASDRIADSIVAYDRAIALLRALPWATDPVLCNNLGTAWMNRGRALQLGRDAASLAAAIASHEEAIELFQTLPGDVSPVYARNLAGAWLNLADALLGRGSASSFAKAQDAALAALACVAGFELRDPEFAEIGLKARRALIDAIGGLLCELHSDCPTRATHATAALADEAGEVVDEGLALARDWEARGCRGFRPLARRLFHFGVQLCRQHQPHFLAEFVLENVGEDGSAVFADDVGFLRAAHESLVLAQAELNRPRMLRVGDPASEALLRNYRELEFARVHVARRLDGPKSLFPHP